MLYFYDGQVRRYISQIIRMLSNFSVQDGKGGLKEIPVMYGDLTRQVANIIRENSENKLPSAPRMSVYVTGLELERDRIQDPSFIKKTNIVERAYDKENNQYLNYQGKNYTVEKLMPMPYLLRVNADIWASSTDQKLQILEQILVFFTPSLEIQTTDNYIDWTSLTVINLDNIQWTNRSIPVGVDSEIDVATLTFTTPIYISTPAKVKRLGAITNIITSMFDETQGTIDLGNDQASLNRWDDVATSGRFTGEFGETAETQIAKHSADVNDGQYGVYIRGNQAQLYGRGSIGTTSWRSVTENLPGTYTGGVSRIFLTSLDTDAVLTGTIALNELDETILIVNWDVDSFPDDDIISSDIGDRTSIDYIIDPRRRNPSDIKTPGTRILLLDDIGGEDALESAIAWKNVDNSQLVASANDIIEWTGTKWNIIFDASETDEITYITNLNTGIQYRFSNGEWLISVEGDYPVGTWRLDLYG
jgi:hypothetical protein